MQNDAIRQTDMLRSSDGRAGPSCPPARIGAHRDRCSDRQTRDTHLHQRCGGRSKPVWQRSETCRQTAGRSLNPMDGDRLEPAEAERPSRGGWRCRGHGSMRRRNPAGSRRCGSVASTDHSGSFRTTSSDGWPRRDRRGYPVELRTAMAPPGPTPRQRTYRACRSPADPLDLLDDLDRSHCSRRGRGCPGYGLLGGYRAGGENVALQMAVVALGGTDVGVRQAAAGRTSANCQPLTMRPRRYGAGRAGACHAAPRPPAPACASRARPCSGRAAGRRLRSPSGQAHA